MAVPPEIMAQALASGGGGAAGAAPDGAGVPPVPGPSGAPSSPEEAMAFLASLGITDPETAKMVMDAIMMVAGGMGGEGAPPGGAMQGPGGQVPPPVA